MGAYKWGHNVDVCIQVGAQYLWVHTSGGTILMGAYKWGHNLDGCIQVGAQY